MKTFSSLNEIAKRRAAKAKADLEGEKPSKVKAWLDPDMYSLPDPEDEDLEEMIAESKQRKQRLKDLVR